MIQDCAKLCHEIYQETGIACVDAGDLRFAVHDRGAFVIVVFRGSDNAVNWLRDLAAVPDKTRDGNWAHHGFVSAFNKLWEPVSSAIAERGKPAVFTGHSLGGAIAVLFAEALSCQAVTFGCPRVWFRSAQAPPLEHVRIFCDDDPVPGVPRLLFKHDSGAIEVKLDDADGEAINPEDHRMSHYLDRIKARYA